MMETELEFLNRIKSWTEAERYAEEVAAYLENEIDDRIELLTNEEEQ